MMPLRVFREIRVLKMAVEVGLVVGMTAAIRPDGLGNLLDAVGGVLLDHAAGLGILVGVVDVLGGVVVFDDLILHNAHAGLVHGHLGQGNPRPCWRPWRRQRRFCPPAPGYKLAKILWASRTSAILAARSSAVSTSLGATALDFTFFSMIASILLIKFYGLADAGSAVLWWHWDSLLNNYQSPVCAHCSKAILKSQQDC